MNLEEAKEAFKKRHPGAVNSLQREDGFTRLANRMWHGFKSALIATEQLDSKYEETEYEVMK